MSNALTGITDYDLWLKEQSLVVNTKSKLNKKSENKSFKELLNEKIDRNGRIDINKLDKREKKLYDSCVEFESLLWKQVLNSMKQTVGKFKLIDGGQTEEIFTDFLYDEYSMTMAKKTQTDISVAIFKQLNGYN